MDASINLTQFHDLMNDLKKFVVQDRQDIIAGGAEQAAVKFDSIVKSQLPPPPRKKSQSQYWKPKQRAWWWWTMSQKALGKSRALPGWRAAYKTVNGVKTLVISGAYKRTGKGVQSLTYDVEKVYEGAVVNYGTNRKYMRYVIDRELQSDYHKGVWTDLQTLAEDSTDQVTRVFLDTVMVDIGKRLGAK